MQPGYSFLQLQSLVSAAYPNRRTAIEPFAHPIDFADCALSSNYVTTYKVLSNCDFWVTNITYLSTDSGGNPQGANGVFLQIEDTGVQERLFYQPVPIINAAQSIGNASQQIGFALDAPRRIAGNSTLQISIETPAASESFTAPSDIQIVLHGVNVYAYS